MAESAETLAAIGLAIAKRRDDAKTARTSSGIEATWKECEEAYIGIDDANRAEFSDARWAKPMSMDGPVTTGRRRAARAQIDRLRPPDRALCRRGLGQARRDPAAGRRQGVLVLRDARPGTDQGQGRHEPGRAQRLRRSADPAGAPGEPVPGGGTAPAHGCASAPGGAVPAAWRSRCARPCRDTGRAAAPAQPAAPAQVPLTVKDLAEENIEIARKPRRAEKRIYDWMVECQHAAEMRKVIDDAARIGVGVLKGPIPAVKKRWRSEIQRHRRGHADQEAGQAGQPAGATRGTSFRTRPAARTSTTATSSSSAISCRTRQVRDLKDVPGYIAAQIDKVLAEGPDGGDKDRHDIGAGKARRRQSQGPVRGLVLLRLAQARRDGHDLDRGGQEPRATCHQGQEGRGLRDRHADQQPRGAATINPLDSGSFPYHSVPWQRRAGHWAGIGVGEQIRMPQKMINAATRAMLNNAGKSGRQPDRRRPGRRSPADGSWVMTPDKIWYNRPTATGSTSRGVRDARDPERHRPADEDHQLRAAAGRRIDLDPADHPGPVRRYAARDLGRDQHPEQQRQPAAALDRLRVRRPHHRAGGAPVSTNGCCSTPTFPTTRRASSRSTPTAASRWSSRPSRTRPSRRWGRWSLNPAYGIDPKKWIKLF
jgi:hypothetical protein